MKVLSNTLNGVLKIEMERHDDSRGWFCEGYQQDGFRRLGISNAFVQDNFSHTIKKGTIRGLHFQAEPYSQSKLFRCIRGTVYDVVVDLRKDSPTYLQWAGFELNGDRFEWLYVPKGFAHGFQTLCDSCDVQYKVDQVYRPESERCIRWNDPDLGINWPVPATNLSEKDSQGLSLADFRLSGG